MKKIDAIMLGLFAAVMYFTIGLTAYLTISDLPF